MLGRGGTLHQVVAPGNLLNTIKHNLKTHNSLSVITASSVRGSPHGDALFGEAQHRDFSIRVLGFVGPTVLFQNSDLAQNHQHTSKTGPESTCAGSGVS